MIGFYVIMIAVIAMSGAVGYTILSSVQTTNALSLAERNAARLEMTATALRQVVIADADGRLFVPMGVPSDGADPTSRTALPDWVSGQALTSWGVDYAYCPYAPVSATGGSAATVYGGSNYTVSLSSDDPVIYGAARDYVISGSRPGNILDVGTPPDVLAFLVSPSNNASAIPSCDNIYWDGRTWLASGPVTGSVRAIALDAMSDSLSRAPRQLRRHVEEGAAGSGLSGSDPADIEDVLAEWRYLRPHRLTIVLADGGGDILIDPTALDLGAGASSDAPGVGVFGRHLVMEAANGDSPVLDGSVAGKLQVPFDFTLNGVDFGDQLTLAGISGSRILVDDASLPALETGGADGILLGGVDITAPTGASAPPVQVIGGSLSIEGAITIDATGSGGSPIRQQGGRIHVDGAITATTGASATTLFEADGFGEVSVTGSGQLNLDGAGLVAMTAYAGPVTVSSASSGAPCADGSATCAVTCPDQRVPLYGTCSRTSLTNTFLSGTEISGDTFTCFWTPVTETSADVTDASGPSGLVTEASCAPKR